MPLPQHLVIGAAKSGTTALHHLLAAHPGVFHPRREEPSYFAFAEHRPKMRGPNGTEASINRTAVVARADYEALFVGAGPHQRRGEVSPAYLYWPGTAERIQQVVPDVRLVVVLRNPADRAYSAYMHARREGRESLGFEEALAAEATRIADDWGLLWRYRDLGRYGSQLEPFYERFSRDQILAIRHDDLVAAPGPVVAQVYEFIGVDPTFRPDLRARYNVSGVPRSDLIHRLAKARGPLRRVGRVAARGLGRERARRWQHRLQARNLRRVPMPATARHRLLDDLDEEIRRTADLTGLDLDPWRAPRLSPSPERGP